MTLRTLLFHSILATATAVSACGGQYSVPIVPDAGTLSDGVARGGSNGGSPGAEGSVYTCVAALPAEFGCGGIRFCEEFPAPSSNFSSWKASCEEGLDGIFSAGRCSDDYREKCTMANISISYYHGSCDLGELQKSMQYGCESQSGDWIVRR